MDDLDLTIQKDARRYRWLSIALSEGKETYIGEAMMSKQELDEYIDSEMAKEEIENGNK